MVNNFYRMGTRNFQRGYDRLSTDDEDIISPFANWKEKTRAEFHNDSISTDFESEKIELGANKSKWGFNSGYPARINKKNNPKPTTDKESIDNVIVETFKEFYDENKVSGANKLYLTIEDDRAYGFYQLNIHTADIDVNIGENPAENHLMIRYNENITRAWEKRVDYINQIFGDMGFEVEKKGRFLHMNYSNPGTKEEMKPILKEAIRGLISTTHLNITFDILPDTVPEAVQAFKDGEIIIFEHLEKKHSDEVRRFNPYQGTGMGFTYQGMRGTTTPISRKDESLNPKQEPNYRSENRWRD